MRTTGLGFAPITVLLKKRLCCYYAAPFACSTLYIDCQHWHVSTTAADGAALARRTADAKAAEKALAQQRAFNIARKLEAVADALKATTQAAVRKTRQLRQLEAERLTLVFKHR